MQNDVSLLYMRTLHKYLMPLTLHVPSRTIYLHRIVFILLFNQSKHSYVRTRICHNTKQIKKTPRRDLSYWNLFDYTVSYTYVHNIIIIIIVFDHCALILTIHSDPNTHWIFTSAVILHLGVLAGCTVVCRGMWLLPFSTTFIHSGTLCNPQNMTTQRDEVIEQNLDLRK